MPQEAAALEVVKALPYPNPSRDGATNLYYELKSPVVTGLDTVGPVYRDPDATVTLGIYSLSYRLIWRKVVRGAQTGPNAEYWEGKDLKGAPLSNGTYLYRVEVSSRGNFSTKHSYVMILR